MACSGKAKAFGGNTLRGLAALLFALVVSSAAHAADEYPTKAIRLIVPVAAGTGLDVDIRPVAQKMAEQLHQPVVIENRPQAGGNVAMELAARAAPDGYTLVAVGLGQAVANPYLYKNLPYDPERDFVPISMVETLPAVLSVSTSLGVNSLAELIARAKARPGEITFASQGNGTFVHLAGELFMAESGVKLQHIPYGQQSPFGDLAGGHVAMMFSGIAPVIGYVNGGLVKILAVSSAHRQDGVLHEVPTFAEAGLPQYEASAWNGFFAPRGLPEPILRRLNAEVRTAAADPEIVARMGRFGGSGVAGSPEQFETFLRAERTKWSKVIRDADVHLD
jgi:tripartite-type tricarboxylate transporter receptor subunit TctC